MRDVRLLGSIWNSESNTSKASQQAESVFNIFVLRQLSDCHCAKSSAFQRPIPPLADDNLPFSTDQLANLPVYVHRLQPDHYELRVRRGIPQS